MNELSHLTDFLSHLHGKYRSNRDRDVATYIPGLGNANPDDFGIGLVTVDGHEFSVGDSQREFTIQSICKPVAFLMTFERHGRERTVLHVAVEPSGNAFNSVELQQSRTVHSIQWSMLERSPSPR